MTEAAWWWSWLLTIVGVTGFLLAGQWKVWWAWYINIACQVLWATYAILTAQWGFLGGVAIYTAVFTANAIKWTRDRPRRFTPEWQRPCRGGWYDSPVVARLTAETERERIRLNGGGPPVSPVEVWLCVEGNHWHASGV